MASSESDKAWVYGWTLGGGLEHAFTENFRGRIEYLYVDFSDIDFSMTDSAATTLDATQSFKNIHM
ncbi:MAG: porin family protein, partial [Alphaproteobacteria bacterium]|nr:porin family protein [Alphaproteobacteria bacterium]